MADMARMERALAKLVRHVNVDAAWESPDATQLDAISFGESLDRKKALPSTRALMAIPCWRADGLSGEGLTDTGTAFITFDVSRDASGPGILMVFCSPRVFDGFSPEMRGSRVIQQLVDLYGPQAMTPIDYIDHCWGTDSFAPGGPHPAAPPYATVSYGSALADPHGRIHWAGTETAGEWAGTMNGAVLTGLRAAEWVAGLASVEEKASV